MTSRIALAILAMVPWLMTACESEQGRPAERVRIPPTSVSGRCPNAEEAVSPAGLGDEGRADVVHETSEDVDGDGQADRVYVVRDEGGAPGCGSFLVAEVGPRRLVTPTNVPGVEHSLETPRIATVGQVDGSGGLEILVDLERGAATQFLAMFTIADGSLTRVEIEDPFAPGGLLPYGGSAGRLEASDCARTPRADVAISVASPDPAGYTIETRLFEMIGARLRPLPQRVQPKARSGADLRSAEVFASAPFASCTAG